jgi:hypothetical protein
MAALSRLGQRNGSTFTPPMLCSDAMFIPLHVITILSVLFLIVLIMFAWRGRSSRRDLLEPPVSPVSLPPEVERDVRALLDQGATIEAIKLVRTSTGLELKEAKDLVDRMAGEW